MGTEAAMRRGLLIVTALWWFGVAVIVVDHNLAIFGHSFLRWNNPTRTTAHFQWHQKPMIQNGKVIVSPGEARRFAVTLPRGFASGRIRVDYEPSGGLVPVTLSAMTAGEKINITSTKSPVEVAVQWSTLTARGRTFDFAISVASPDAAVAIKNVIIRAQR